MQHITGVLTVLANKLYRMTDGLIRLATETDIDEIVGFIEDLADHEDHGHHVQITGEALRAALITGQDTPGGSPAVWCFVLEHEGDNGQLLGGIALWFLNFSTWTGTHGIHLEDLYVRPSLRGHGYGVRLLGSLAAECIDRGYERLEWEVLDQNTHAIGFYDSIGGQTKDDWTTYRLSGEHLAELAQRA